MKLLLAEDDPTTNLVLTQSLTQWGYDVLTVQDGNAAWEILQTADAPRIAILDWEMPSVDGVEICRRMRDLESKSYTYLILLTGKTDKEDIVEGLQAGADDYLAKPFNPNELKMRLQVGQRILNLEYDLIHTLNQLKDSEQKRIEFIAALTHDLRTPLVAEQRALELIQHTETDVSARGLILLKSLVTNNDNLLTLVNQLLDNFYTDSVQIEIAKQSVSLYSLVSESLLSVSTLASPKFIQLHNRVPDTMEPILVDPEHLKRIITNLLGNAISYIPKGSEVEVLALDRNAFIEIQIKDNGQGINPELLPHLFERYYSSSGAGKSTKIGSGLGLSICKTLVELHGGTIQAQSTLNKGTCFSFTLPKSPTMTEINTGPINVLIVEDQELARVGLQFALEGIENIVVVGTAENGQEAIEAVKNLNPDLVLMDIVMPVMDGITATQQLKALFPQTKVLMLTSQTQGKEVYGALAAGADGYCLKDIKTDLLADAMRRVYHGQRWLDPAIAQWVEKAIPDATTLKTAEPDSHKEQFNAALTEREIQTLRLIAQQKSIYEIAGIFYEDEEKVNSYLTAILNKLAVDNLSAASAKAIQIGLIKGRA